MQPYICSPQNSQQFSNLVLSEALTSCELIKALPINQYGSIFQAITPST